MPASLLGSGVFVAGALASLVWHALYGPSTPIADRGVRLALTVLPQQLWNGARDLVAGFGYLEFRLPAIVYLLWFAFVGAIFFAAVKAGQRRERHAVVVAGLLAFLVPAGVWMVFARATGIGINGREYMPGLVAVPMVAGEVLYRHRDRISSRGIAALAKLATIAAVMQFVAWYLNGQRAAVGTAGSLLFASHAQWKPPLGWLVWIAVAGCATVLIASITIAPSIIPTRDRANRAFRRKARPTAI
jgi:hypothetical protein